MRILHAIETLSRNAGGLPVAVTGIADCVAKADPSSGIGIVTTVSPSDEEIATLSTVYRVSGSLPAQVVKARRVARRLEGSFDVVHQHGLWAPVPVAIGNRIRAHGKPHLLSPHGMLEAWALHHHFGRKRVAWKLYQKNNVDAACALHAASHSEALRFRELGLSHPVAVIPHGVAPVSAEPLCSEAVKLPKSHRQVLFLSRIHPKKGLDLLLKAWAEVEAPEWQLVVVGNDDGGYRPRLEALAKRLRLLPERVRFDGPLFGKEKDTAFRRADLFVLPSYSENFGIVVPEALQYGLPLVTTTGTPWDALPRERCGWQVEATVEAIGDALNKAIALSDEERRTMGERGRAFVEREHRWPAIAAKYLAVYRWISEGGEVPAWVSR